MAPIQIISVEGNIGTGKSTFLKKLKARLSSNQRFCFLEEPIDIWTSITDENGVNIIEKYYQNQTKYAFAFQMMALISRLTSLKEIIASKKYDVIIMERSLYTDNNVFAKMLYDDKKIEEIEYAIYKKWYNDFVNEFPPINFVYLTCDPVVSAKRVEKRNRLGETIAIEYLENCHKYHDNWLLKENNFRYPVIILDANCDINDNPEIIENWINQIETLINKRNKLLSWRNIIDYAYMIQEILY
jgi:deoxyadenosine/deoxycytidine kinase